MSSTSIPAIVQTVIDARRVEKGEIVALRRWVYGDGIIHAEDAEALFRLNAVLGGNDAEFNQLFIEALTDYVVYQEMPTGRVTAEQADWLISRMGGAAACIETASELDLLVNVMEEATEIPNSLAVFALAQVKHAAITGEGPAARGRMHFSRTVDARDVALLSRILHRTSGSAISRPEAEVLFDIADACNSPANDAGWSHLFVRAIANHLLGSEAPLKQPHGIEAEAPLFGPEGDWSSVVTRVNPAGAHWLQTRIHRDGRISRAERALLAFVDGSVDDSVARAAIIRMA